MTNHHATCDPHRIDLFLQQKLSDGEQAAFESHLTECDECCRQLEATAASDEVWRHVQDSLRDEHDDSALDSAAGEDVSSSQATVLKLLVPTDDDRMIGRWGTYEVVGVVGTGGMGVVLKAFDAALNRYVAIKILAPHLGSSGAAIRRFSREGKAAAAVVHDNVIEIYGVAEAAGLPYLVMPYVRGPSLQRRLDDEGPLALVEILRVGMQAAAGLAAAHAQGLVHRDVKPANILLADGIERVKLTDFGLARAADDASLTRTGVIAGTPQYMSPEQARGEPVDPRSDLFSLGSVLYAMCTARPPFRAETSYGVLRRITDEEPRPIREINPDIPDWLCGIVAKLMAKWPEDRFQSAHEVAALLEQCLAHVQQPTAVPLPTFSPLLPGEGQGERAAARSLRSRNTLLKGTLIMLALLGISLFAAGIVSTNPPDISGNWQGEDWGHVTLTQTAPGEYAGTYTDTLAKEKGPGKIELKWSRIERRFNGAWREGEDDRFGDLSIHLVGKEIRGGLTTSDKSKINPATPRLADLAWKRAAAPAVNLPADVDGNEIPLNLAIQDFNKRMASNLGTRNAPPLTENEVIKLFEYSGWKPGREIAAKRSIPRSHSFDTIPNRDDPTKWSIVLWMSWSHEPKNGAVYIRTNGMEKERVPEKKDSATEKVPGTVPSPGGRAAPVLSAAEIDAKLAIQEIQIAKDKVVVKGQAPAGAGISFYAGERTNGWGCAFPKSTRFTASLEYGKTGLNCRVVLDSGDPVLALVGAKHIGNVVLSDGRFTFRPGGVHKERDGSQTATIGKWVTKSGGEIQLGVTLTPPQSPISMRAGATSGPHPHALQFDGNHYAKVEPPPKFTSGDFTIALWFNPVRSGDWAFPFMRGFGWRDQRGDIGFQFNRDSGNLGFAAYSAGKSGVPSGWIFGWGALEPRLRSPVHYGQWNHAVVTRHGDTYTMWMNGARAGSEESSADISDAGNTNPFIVGGMTYEQGVGTMFQGALDDFRIFRRCLSDKEIAELYKSNGDEAAMRGEGHVKIGPLVAAGADKVNRKENELRPRTFDFDFSIVVARHVMLLEGREIVTWPQIEEKLARHAYPSPAHPGFYVTNGAYEARLLEPAQKEMLHLKRDYRFSPYGGHTMSRQASFRYDRIKTTADLKVEEAAATEGVVVTPEGKPVANAEVILVTPIDKSIPYNDGSVYQIQLEGGRVNWPLDHVITHSDAAGRFTVYPPKGQAFSIVAMHANAGIGMLNGKPAEAAGAGKTVHKLTLAPWAGVDCDISKEAENQDGIIRSFISQPGSLPKLIFDQSMGVPTKQQSTLRFHSTHVPPGPQTVIYRCLFGFWTGAHFLPGATVELLPGETRQISLGPVSKEQRQLLKEIWSIEQKADKGNGVASPRNPNENVYVR